MVIVLMGVSGCGKTTVGQLLADRLGWPFYDGDDYHPAANIAKMAAGKPLDDENRRGWLETLAGLIEKTEKASQNAVMACSALKQNYRDRLARKTPQTVHFVYLKGSYEQILDRMQQRGGHFMKPDMLRSQFDILEEPSGILALPITLPLNKMVDQIIDEWVKPHPGRESLD